MGQVHINNLCKNLIFIPNQFYLKDQDLIQVFLKESSISIQPVEKIIYGDNSTKRYRNILRHELDLKWIKLLQTPHPLGFDIYHDGNISRLPDFDVFFSFRYP